LALRASFGLRTYLCLQGLIWSLGLDLGLQDLHSASRASFGLYGPISASKASRGLQDLHSASSASFGLYGPISTSKASLGHQDSIRPPRPHSVIKTRSRHPGPRLVSRSSSQPARPHQVSTAPACPLKLTSLQNRFSLHFPHCIRQAKTKGLLWDVKLY
jgi:hypothetical protein